MALLEDQLVVKRSKLPGAGKGLFTRKVILKGTRIVEYKGVIRKRKILANMPYTFVVKPDHLIDAKGFKDGVAHFANDATGTGRRRDTGNNSRYERDGLRVFIQATRKIKAGEEILVFYGADYWEEDDGNGAAAKNDLLIHKYQPMAKAKKAAAKKPMKKAAPKKAVKKAAKKATKKAVKKAAPKKAVKKAAKKAAPKKAAKKAAPKKVKPSIKGKSGKSGG